MKQFTIKITCKDEKGLVYRISEILLENGLNIIKNDEFVDNEKALFFMRTEVSGIAEPEKVIDQLKNIVACSGGRNDNAAVHTVERGYFKALRSAAQRLKFF